MYIVAQAEIVRISIEESHPRSLWHVRYLSGYWEAATRIKKLRGKPDPGDCKRESFFSVISKPRNDCGTQYAPRLDHDRTEGLLALSNVRSV